MGCAPCAAKRARAQAALDKSRDKIVVVLPGGTKVEHMSEAAAKSFVARHPGARIAA